MSRASSVDSSSSTSGCRQCAAPSHSHQRCAPPTRAFVGWRMPALPCARTLLVPSTTEDLPNEDSSTYDALRHAPCDGRGSRRLSPSTWCPSRQVGPLQCRCPCPPTTPAARSSWSPRRQAPGSYTCLTGHVPPCCAHSLCPPLRLRVCLHQGPSCCRCPSSTATTPTVSSWTRQRTTVSTCDLPSRQRNGPAL